MRPPRPAAQRGKVLTPPDFQKARSPSSRGSRPSPAADRFKAQMASPEAASGLHPSPAPPWAAAAESQSLPSGVAFSFQAQDLRCMLLQVPKALRLQSRGFTTRTSLEAPGLRSLETPGLSVNCRPGASEGGRRGQRRHIGGPAPQCSARG